MQLSLWKVGCGKALAFTHGSWDSPRVLQFLSNNQRVSIKPAESNKAKNLTSSMSRRRFVGSAVGATIGLQIVPRHVIGGQGQTPPSERLHIAGVGVGGQGRAGRGKHRGDDQAETEFRCLV